MNVFLILTLIVIFLINIIKNENTQKKLTIILSLIAILYSVYIESYLYLMASFYSLVEILYKKVTIPNNKFEISNFWRRFYWLVLLISTSLVFVMQKNIAPVDIKIENIERYYYIFVPIFCIALIKVKRKL